MDSSIERMCSAYERATQRKVKPKGPKMAPPFSLEEVEQAEQESGVSLPPLLKAYLTRVSKETMIGDYGTTVSLHELYSKLPSNPLTAVHIEMNHQQQGDNDAIILTAADDFDLTHGTMVIGYDGCAFDWLVIIRGEMKGKVLRTISAGGHVFQLLDLERELLRPAYFYIHGKRDEEGLVHWIKPLE